MKKQIKVYLHHDHFEPVTYEKKTGIFGFVKYCGSFILNVVIGVCYFVGASLIAIALLPIKFLNKIFIFPSNVTRVAQKFKTKKFQRAIGVFVLMAVLASSSIHGLALIAAGQDLKGKVLGSSDAGIGYLEDAKTSLETQNISAAQANFTKALEQFKSSEESLNSAGITMKSLLAVVPQKHDADSLLRAAQLITEAGLKGTELIQITGQMKLTAVGIDTGEGSRNLLSRAQSLLNQTVDLANAAATEINSVSISSIPKEYQPAFVTAKDVATLFQSNITSVKEVCGLLFDILLDQKNVLIVFQNNNEIRASGGFMGTIGTAKLSNGNLGSLDIRTVYDWDGQLKEKILPPMPLRTVTDQWFLRDSNWFANFPQSASRISALYEKEGGETPDLIITMTPDVIISMLKKTGPITLPQYNITLNAENFVEQTQTATSINYDKTLNQPKQFLADFFPILMDKLGEQDGLMTFVEIFQENLYKKHILLYAKNKDLEDRILSFNWGGEIKQTDRDYLSIVNSNLGGTKTDRFIEYSTVIDSTINSDGEIINTVNYTVKNPLPNISGLNNKNFVRFYVPLGSELLENNGFTQNVKTPILDETLYLTDDQVRTWQGSVKQDTATQAYAGQEAGKTWFGGWLTVEGSEIKTVTLKYRLPFKIGKLDRHSLLIQKQPGSLSNSIEYRLNFAGRKSLWNSNYATVENETLHYQQGLIADSFIGLVLENK